MKEIMRNILDKGFKNMNMELLKFFLPNSTIEGRFHIILYIISSVLVLFYTLH